MDPTVEGRLLAEIERVSGQLGELRDLYTIEGKKRDRRIRGNRVLNVLCIVGLALGGVLYFHSIAAANDARAELRAAEESRVERTSAACAQFNRQQSAETAAQIAQSHAFVQALATNNGATAVKPAERSVVAAFNTTQDRLIQAGHRPRDCSPEGITAFYGPQSPTTPPKNP